MSGSAPPGRQPYFTSRFLLAGLLVPLLACGGGSSPAPVLSTPPVPPVPPVARDYVADLKSYVKTNSATITADIASNDVGVYYGDTYYLMGMAAAAEASGDTAIMDALLGYTSQIMALAKPLVLNGVSCPQLGPLASDGKPQQSLTFLIAGTLARTAAVITKRPEFSTTYQAQAAQLVAFVDQSIFKYWFDKTNGVYADPSSPWPAGDIPWVSTALGGWGEYDYFAIPAMHYGIISAWMYQATGNALYLDAATRLAQDFKTNHLVAANGAYQWDVGKYGFESPDNQADCQDTSHANRVPMMMQAMYENGIVFTKADMDLLAGTLLQIIWNQDGNSPLFANYINGSNLPYRTFTTPGSNGLIYDGWAMLGRDSTEVQTLVEVCYQDIASYTWQSPPLNASLNDNSSTYGLMELSGTLALNAAP